MFLWCSEARLADICSVPQLLTACLKFMGNLFSLKLWRVKHPRLPKKQNKTPNTLSWLSAGAQRTLPSWLWGFIGMQQDLVIPTRAPGQPRVGFQLTPSPQGDSGALNLLLFLSCKLTFSRECLCTVRTTFVQAAGSWVIDSRCFTEPGVTVSRKLCD